MNCAYCGDSADFTCNCALKVTYICSNHVGNHYKLNANIK